jgi:hypothetical protein
MVVGSKESSSFLKKRTKKLFESGTGAVVGTTPMAQSKRIFFASFFIKKEALPCLAF